MGLGDRQRNRVAEPESPGRTKNRTPAASASPSVKRAVTPDWGMIDLRPTLMETTCPGDRAHGSKSRCVERSERPYQRLLRGQMSRSPAPPEGARLRCPAGVGSLSG